MRIISKILIIVLIPSALSLVIHFSGINREILAKNKTSINIQTSVNSDNKFEYEDENEDEDEDENENNKENQNSISINTKSSAISQNSVKNSILYAEDVKVTNSASDDKKPILTPNPSISRGPTPTGIATVSANTNVKIKANGPVDQVILFLNQILSFLKSLV